MMSFDGEVTVAAVQAAPVFLDRDATIEVLLGHIGEAASEGARLVVFPEAIVPAYPAWIWRRPGWSDADLYDRLYDQAVDIPGAATARLGAAAREAEAWLAVGVTERVRSGSLYNTLLYVAPDGNVAGAHRKLLATGPERTVWGHGDGSSLTVVDAGFARIGGLTCWENLMPLARVAIYQQGIEIYLAPTWDHRDVWIATLRHIAYEARAFVIGTNTCLRGSDVPPSLQGADELRGAEWLSHGNTAIVGPMGDVIAGPLVGEPGMLVARLDMRQLRWARREFDGLGHYGRPDVFEFAVR
jgi:nitrilase